MRLLVLTLLTFKKVKLIFGHPVHVVAYVLFNTCYSYQVGSNVSNDSVSFLAFQFDSQPCLQLEMMKTERANGSTYLCISFAVGKLRVQKKTKQNKTNKQTTTTS